MGTNKIFATDEHGRNTDKREPGTVASILMEHMNIDFVRMSNDEIEPPVEKKVTE